MCIRDSITGLPTDLQASDVTAIACVALAMAFVATLYPAWRAARTAPAEALRYDCLLYTSRCV